jgi:hypothetical protein
MDHEKEVGIEDQHDPLADAADAAHDLSVDGVNRRIDRAKDEGAVEYEPLKGAPDDVARQRFDVNDNVWELGQDERLTTDDYFLSQLTICSRVQ